jgi:hypothetical protein
MKYIAAIITAVTIAITTTLPASAREYTTQVNTENESASSVLALANRLSAGKEHTEADYAKHFDLSVHALAWWDRTEKGVPPLTKGEKNP